MQNYIIDPFQKQNFIFLWSSEENHDEQIEITLSDGAEGNVLGVFLGCENFQYKNYIKIVHKGKNTKARIFARGVALDASRIDFSGMLRVEQGAKGTDTYFDARFMVLSDKASAHTFPGLEIHENDIAKGGHAATVARVREEDLFYLRSRGISREIAQGMMVKGFFEPVIQMIDVMEQSKVRNLIEEKLGSTYE